MQQIIIHRKTLSFIIFLLIWIFTPFHLRYSSAEVIELDRLTKWPHEQSMLKPDPDVIFGRLSNGFRYALKKNTTPKHRISMHLFVHTGSAYETDDQQGLAHFLEHMLFCGSTNFKPGELVKYFQRIGMKFGPDANAHTGFFQTVYDIILPDAQPKTIQEGLMVIKDYAEGALLLESEIDRERKVVLTEKITRDSASYRTFVKALSFELPGSIIPKRFPIGIEEVLHKIDQKQMKLFYDSWYRPELMILMMVGDFDEKIAETFIQKEFSTMSSRLPPPKLPDIGSVDHTGIKAFYHYEQEEGNTRISIETIRKNRFSFDSVERQKDKLLKDIGDRIIKDRLEKQLRQSNPPFTSAAIYSQEYFSYFELYEITAETSPDRWKDTLSALEQTLRNALTYGFTQSELERVQKDFLSDLDKAVEKSATRESQDIANQLMNSISSNSVFQSPEQRRELLAPIIRSATLDMIYKSFKDGWSQDHRLILVSGNLQLNTSEKSPEDQILEVYEQSQKIPVTKPEELLIVKFPYLPEPSGTATIREKKFIDDLNIHQIDFENGVRLNMKQTDFEANTVRVVISFGNGKASEPLDQPGIGELSESVINESGVGKLNKDELDQALAGTNVSVVFDVNEECFEFRGSCLTKEAELLFQVLYTYVMDPGFRENDFQLTKERFLQQYQALSQSIDGVFQLQTMRFLSGGDKRFGFPTDEEIKRISLSNIREWILQPLINDPLEISVVGSFDRDTIITLVSRYFGTINKRQMRSQLDLSRVPKFPVGQSLIVPVKTDIKKSIVVVAYPSEDMWDISKTRRLSALASAFSEKLRIRIREELGSAYSSYAYNNPSRAYPGYGVFQAVVYLNPGEEEKIVKEIQNIALDLAKNGVTPDELKRVVDPIITGIRDLIQTNDYWLKTTLNRSVRHPEQIEWSRTILSDYQSITQEEILEVAKKYLNNSQSAVVIIKPADR